MRVDCPYCGKGTIIKHDHTYSVGDEEFFICDWCKEKYRALFYIEALVTEIDKPCPSQSQE
jgi:hypothetical protein